MDDQISKILKNVQLLRNGGIETVSRVIEYENGYNIIKNKYYNNNNDKDNNNNHSNNKNNLYNVLNILIGVLTNEGYKEEKKRNEIILKIQHHQEKLKQIVKPASTDTEEKIKFYMVSFECFYSIGYIYGEILKSIDTTTTNPYPIINRAISYYSVDPFKNSHFYSSKLKKNGITEYYVHNIKLLSDINCNENVEQWKNSLLLYKNIKEQYYNLGWFSVKCYQYESTIGYFKLY